MSTDPLGIISAPPWQVEVVESIPSTNALLASRAADGAPSGLAVVADHQLAGRGRRGNRWEAPSGSALLLSALLRPDRPMMEWPRLAIATALAVCLALEETTSLSPLIKWPNDILVDGCKIAGILLESQSSDATHPGWVVLGIGLNVHTTDFPLNLRYPATSVRLAAGHTPARSTLAISLLKHLDECATLAFESWPSLLEKFATRDATFGKRIQVETSQGVMMGTGAGLAADGSLLLLLPNNDTPTPLRDAHSLVILDND